jgi:hypothetical protein
MSQEEVIEYGYLKGYGRIPKCFQMIAAKDFPAFELSVRLGVLMERKRSQKLKRKLARA